MAARKKTPTKPAKIQKTVAKAAPAAKAPVAKAAPIAKAAPVAKAAAKKSAAVAPAAPAKKVAKKKAAPAPAPAKVAAAPAKAAPVTTDVLARKIVRVTTADPAKLKFDEFYTPEAVSYEPTGDPAIGAEGFAAKSEFWSTLQEKSTWKARNVVVNKNTIVIEWEAEVHLRDGRTVVLPEVAVHQVKNGKIFEERYYYDPTLLAPAPKPQRAAPVPMPAIEPGEPVVEPIDL